MIKQIFLNGNKISYKTEGSGKPVILLHGFGEDGKIWNNQLDFLKNFFLLIIPDFPGCGESAFVTNVSMEELSHIIKEILDNESIDSCIMIGHSMGGYVTLAFAERNPNRLDAIGLFHSTAFADSEEKKNTRRKGIEFINEYGAFGFLKTTTENLFSPLTKEEKPAIINEQINKIDYFNSATLIAYYRAMMQRPDRTPVLSKSTIPVLFIAGKYDIAVPQIDILKQCHLPVLSYIHTLKKSGHMGMLEEPEECNLILKTFVEEIKYA